MKKFDVTLNYYKSFIVEAENEQEAIEFAHMRKNIIDEHTLTASDDDFAEEIETDIYYLVETYDYNDNEWYEDGYYDNYEDARRQYDNYRYLIQGNDVNDTKHVHITAVRLTKVVDGDEDGIGFYADDVLYKEDK